MLGVLLMRFFEHSLVYYLDGIGIPFLWLGTGHDAFSSRWPAFCWPPLIGALGCALSRLAGEPPRALRSHPVGGLSRVLACADLRKAYATERGEIEAVRGIDLDIAQGEYRGHRRPVGLREILAHGHDRRPQPADPAVKSVSRGPTSGPSPMPGSRPSAITVSATSSSSRACSASLRIIDNVALPALLGRRMEAAAAYEAAADLLDQLGLGDYLDAYPSEISAGEQRRAVIARALVNAPALLLADEPTSDLDEQTEIEMMDQLRALNRDRGMTLIIVTHNLRLAEHGGSRPAYRRWPARSHDDRGTAAGSDYALDRRRRTE